MHMVGLFDRPASEDCVRALRKKPPIKGLTDEIIELNEGAWQRAIARLREVRLLAPQDPSAPETLDTHPLVREWFGERLRQTVESAWKAAHSRLYDHLRRTTNEGNSPTLEALAPLYQAAVHACQAGNLRRAARAHQRNARAAAVGAPSCFGSRPRARERAAALSVRGLGRLGRCRAGGQEGCDLVHASRREPRQRLLVEAVPRVLARRGLDRRGERGAAVGGRLGGEVAAHAIAGRVAVADDLDLAREGRRGELAGKRGAHRRRRALDALEGDRLAGRRAAGGLARGKAA